MAKRVFETFLIFVGVLFIGIVFCNEIEKGTLMPVESLIAAVIAAVFYLIMVFIYTRKHPNLYFFIGIILILYFLENQKDVAESSISIFSIFAGIMGFIEGSIAKWHAEEYKKEKIPKKADKIEFEEISPDGKVTRKGKLDKVNE